MIMEGTVDDLRKICLGYAENVKAAEPQSHLPWGEKDEGYQRFLAEKRS